MSAELSGMVHDRPMTENQSVIEKIAMINCGGKILKFFPERPLISGRCGLARLPGAASRSNPDMGSFILDPAIQSGPIPVKRLRIIRESNRESIVYAALSASRRIRRTGRPGGPHIVVHGSSAPPGHPADGRDPVRFNATSPCATSTCSLHALEKYTELKPTVVRLL